MKEALMALEELQNAKGAKAKEAVLKKYKNEELFKMLLYYACHPRLTYKLSEATLDKEWPTNHSYISGNIFFICEWFNGLSALPDQAVIEVVDWLNDQPEWERKWYRAILTKTLRLGVTHKTINKVIPGLFPEWEVQQAYPIEKYPLKEGEWFAVTEKLNGVRCTYYRGQLIARSGEVFSGLEHILNELCLWQDVVFDGELTLKSTCRGNMSDNEAFRAATGILNSDGDKSSIQFTIFDVLDADEFDDGESLNPYRERRLRLERFGMNFIYSYNVSILPCLYRGCAHTEIDRLLEQMVSEDKEGLMVNLDTPYLRKRNSGILKVKRFYSMDLPIIRLEEGTGKYKGMMGSIVVDYKGNEVGVGTGFTDDQRRHMWDHREFLTGTLAEVKYKEISQNKKTGAESLQFPVFVRLRDDKSEVSYG